MADTNFTVDANVNPAIANLQRLGKEIERVGSNFGSAFSAANNAVTALSAAIIGAGIATAAYADGIVDIAKANQLATAEVMGLSKALQQNGGDADNVGRMFQAMANNIEQANSGNIKSLGTFQRLGVSISDLGSLSNSELNNKLLKSLAAISDPTERAALSMQIYGKALTGVDIVGLAGDVDDLTAKYGPHQDAIDTAAAAFDKMAGIMGDLKVAFALTFEPVFKYVANLKIEVKDLVELWKLMATALALVTGAAVLGGFIKLISLAKTLNTVVRGNPLIAIAGALLSAGTAAATYFGITKEMESAQEAVNVKIDETPVKIEKVKRSQEGLNDLFDKQKKSLEKIGDQLNLNFQKSLRQTTAEFDNLKLSEDQKKVKEAILKVEEDRQTALLQLKQANDALDKDSQTRNAANYTNEKKRIEDLAAAQKKSLEDQIGRTQDYQRALKDLQASSVAYSDIQTQVFETAAKFNIERSSLSDRIALESKLTEVTKIRAALMAQTSGLSEEEKNKVIDVISIATTQTDLLKKNYKDINGAIAEHIQIMGDQGVISKETTDKILSGSSKQRDAIAVSADALTRSNSYVVAQSRTFSDGWNQAFKQYAEDAANAAKYAQNMFAKTMQGMEDLIVNFAKTGKFEWKNFVGSLVEELLRSQLKQLMSSVFSFQGTGGGSAGSLLGNLFAGMFANGGTIPGGQFGIVGERGPEFVSGPATVTPMGGGGGSVVYNINAVDAPSFKAMIARDPSFIHAVAMQGAAGIPSRR